MNLNEFIEKNPGTDVCTTINNSAIVIFAGKFFTCPHQ